MRKDIRKFPPKDPFLFMNKSVRNGDNNTDDIIQYMTSYPEEWRLMYPIPDIIDIAPNSYYISSYGRIMSIINQNNAGMVEISVQTIDTVYKSSGLITIDDRQSPYRINRLVGFYFLPLNYNTDYSKLEVDHIDADPSNNHWTNLAWVTPEENKNLKGFHQTCIRFNRMDEWYALVAERKALVRESTYDEYMYGLSLSNKYLEVEILKCKAIYDDTLISKDNDIIAKKYNVSAYKVSRIRSLAYPFNMMLWQEFLKKESNRHAALDEELVLKIYSAFDNGATYDDILRIYGIHNNAATHIKYLRGPYEYLRYKYGLKPIADRYWISDQMAIEIYNMLKDGATIVQVKSKYKINKDSIVHIRQCSHQFTRLQTEYGLEPLPCARGKR